MMPAAHQYRDEIFETVTLSEALDILCNFKDAEAKEQEDANRGNRHKASSFLKVVLRTVPAMKKTDNPFFGQIQKVSVSNYAVNWDYASVLARQQDAVKGGVSDEKRAVYARKWGVKVDGVDETVSPLLMVSIGIDDTDNNPNLYLTLFVNTAFQPTATWYEWIQGTKTGLALNDDEFGKLKKLLPDSEKQEATMKDRSGVEHPIVLRSPHVQSLSEFKIGGTYYVITDSTLPVIPDDVRTLALDYVTLMRKNRAFRKELMDTAKKLEESLVKGGLEKEAACLQVTQARVAKLVDAKLVHPDHAEREVRKYMEQRKFWAKKQWEGLAGFQCIPRLRGDESESTDDRATVAKKPAKAGIPRLRGD